MSVSILVAGDYVPNGRIESSLDVRDYSFFKEVVPLTSAVDYSIVNLEAPIVDNCGVPPILKTGPSLRAKKEAADSLQFAGFNCATLANNHFRDYGDKGVLTTISELNRVSIDFCGGGKDLIEAKRVLYKTIKGKRLAFINCCEHEWSIATKEYGGSNPLDLIEIHRTIISAKEVSDYVVVIVHGGTEYYQLPTPRMKKYYHFFVDSGADTVINHHQHCYSGYEVYHDKPIFYGLGNFCFDTLFNKTPDTWRTGILVEIIFDNKISFKLHPYEQCSLENPSVALMENTDVFTENIAILNSIIADDEKLSQAFGDMALKRNRVIDSLLAPYTGRLSLLAYKGLLPSFVNNVRRRQLLAHMQCEAHKDILQYCLNNRLKNE